MAIVRKGSLNHPNVVCLSSDIDGGKIAGLQPGETAFLSDTGAWKICLADSSLADFSDGSVTVSNNITPGTAGTASTEVMTVQGIAGGTPVPAIGSSIVVPVTPTITAGAYHANDVVGTKLELANAARLGDIPTTLQSLVITDLAMQNAALNIFLFSGQPATGTYTDNAECDIDDTDLGLCVGVISTGDGQWISAKDNSVFSMQNIGLVIKASTTSVWIVIKTTGTPTYASVSDLVLKFGFYRD